MFGVSLVLVATAAILALGLAIGGWPFLLSLWTRLVVVLLVGVLVLSLVGQLLGWRRTHFRRLVAAPRRPHRPVLSADGNLAFLSTPFTQRDKAL